MKTGKVELDVDVIGGQEPLTPEEEKALSAFIKAKKSKINRKVKGQKKEFV